MSVVEKVVVEAFSAVVHRPEKSASVTMVLEALVYFFHSPSKPPQVVVLFQKYCSELVAQYQAKEEVGIVEALVR